MRRRSRSGGAVTDEKQRNGHYNDDVGEGSAGPLGVLTVWCTERLHDAQLGEGI